MLEEAEEIGRRVRRARLRLGMTQADLAAALGKTQGWVSKMERGHIELDRVGLLNLTASELHVHPNDLVGRPYNSSPAENQWQVSAAAIMRELCRSYREIITRRGGPGGVQNAPRGRLVRAFRRPTADHHDFALVWPGHRRGARFQSVWSENNV